MTHFYKCVDCGEYTLDEKKCPKCGGMVRNPRPPKFSLVDKYGEYRRKAKRASRKSSV